MTPEEQGLAYSNWYIHTSDKPLAGDPDWLKHRMLFLEWADKEPTVLLSFVRIFVQAAAGDEEAIILRKFLLKHRLVNA